MNASIISVGHFLLILSIAIAVDTWILLDLNIGTTDGTLFDNRPNFIFEIEILFEALVVKDMVLVALKLDYFAVVCELAQTNWTVTLFTEHELRIRDLTHYIHNSSIPHRCFDIDSIGVPCLNLD